MMINKRLIAMVPEAKRYILLKVLVNWFSLLAGIVLWFVIGGLLDAASIGEAGTKAVRVFAIAACCIALRFALARAAARLTHKAVCCVKLQLRDALYEKLRRLGGSYTDVFPTAEIVQLAGEGVEQLESYFGNYLPQFFYAMLAPVTLFLVFVPRCLSAAVALFLCVPLIPVAIAAVQTVAKRLLGKYWDAYANLGDSFLENLQGLTTLKVYSADEQRHQAMNQDAETFRKVTMKVLTMQLNSVTIMDFVAYGGTALGSILCARAFAKGSLPLGSAISMILLASEFFLAMRALGSYFHVAMNGVAASDRMFRLLDLPEQEKGKQSVSSGDFQARNLCFAYTPGRPVLSGLDFRIPQGSFVSIVGESGCGKSTLAALLCGTRGGYTGSLRLGRTELKDAAPESLREAVTVVSSDNYLFAGTVRETLLMGKGNASEEALLTALQRVNLLPFVLEKGGLDLLLAERASNLSGGQRQRLALARALLKDSPVYIFDEAASNIDAESESDIMRVIHSLKGKHTVILISHRLANVVDSDEILFLRRGHLTERGSHAALLARNGAYASLFRAQRELENLAKEETQLCEETG